MSATNQTAGPSRLNSNFAAIFQAALSEYEAVTGKPLRDYPFATQLENCDNPQAVLGVLQAQAEAFSKFRKRDERLMAWLDPIVHILFSFSATLGLRKGIGLPFTPAKTIFTGMGVLLVVIAQILSVLALSTKAVTDRRAKKFLKRLIGNSGVEDALLRLDSFTKEENLLAVAKNLEVVHHVKTLAEGHR